MAEDWARPVVHWEIAGRDAEKLRDFYAQLFNWSIGSGPVPNWIPAGIGGPEPGPAGHIRQSEQPGITLFIQVLDLRASLTKAEQMGGKIVMQPLDQPGGPTIAVILDPEGNSVGLVQQ